jgi:hypothetical protein
MKINYYGFTLYSGDDTRAKWVLKYYWQDEATVECRYFATQREAQRFALHEGYHKEHYIIARNK